MRSSGARGITMTVGAQYLQPVAPRSCRCLVLSGRQLLPRLPSQQAGLERVGGGTRPARGGECLLDPPGAVAQPDRFADPGAQAVGAQAASGQWTPRSAGILCDVMGSRLELTRSQILGFRRSVGALDQRLAPGARSLRRAAWAGLQDSMPRAALLSIHARVEGTHASTWEDPSLVQLWGPRHSVFVVAARDRGVFSLGTLPEAGNGRRRAEEMAARLQSFSGGAQVSSGEVGRALGIHPGSVRYAAPTGTVLIRWDGARRPTVWTMPAPAVDPGDARLELARRYLHIYGPTTPEAFARWAGLGPRDGAAAFRALDRSLTPVQTPVGDGWILSRDEPALRAEPGPVAPARLLPSGDAYWLLQGADQELLVPDPGRRRKLWTRGCGPVPCSWRARSPAPGGAPTRP
jgi:hypothetical protein